MNKLITTSLLAVSMTFTGCASIVSRSTQTISFKSVPETTQISITNRSGEKVHAGQTPATVTLKKGAGYFKSENYKVTFSKDGFESKTVDIKGSVNGWYFGNIIFGGIIGLLIVDPLTGAMYTLTPKDVNAVLEQNNIKVDSADKTLTVILKEEVPTEIMARAKILN